ncbi:MAG: response regulator [Clostridiales bacterium]|nr:response regulator [Clostridiales bacterium]
MPIKIIIADDVKDMREMIVKMLGASRLEYEIVATCENGVEVLDTLKHKKADIVLMDINMPEMNGLEATEVISGLYPHVQVIMMSVQHETEYLKKAMLAGAKAYVMKPVDMVELIETIETTFERAKLLTPVSVSNEKVYDAKIISFFSAKGGVGNTSVALNAGITFHEMFDKKVLIVDLDLRFGDIALMMNRQNETTIKELMDDSPIEEFADVSSYLFSYAEGLDFLFAPKDPESAEYISKDRVHKFLELAKRHYEIIIIDTGVNFDEVTLAALDLSEKVVIVSNQEVTGIKNTKVCLKVMQTLNYDYSKIKLLINMSDDRFGISKGNVQKAFEYEILGFVPEDSKLVRNAINTGIPFALTKNSLKKPLKALCDALLTE